jgi:lysophospholipase L1-like esterase
MLSRFIGIALVTSIVLCAAPALAHAQARALIVGDSLTSGFYASTVERSYAVQVSGWLGEHGYDAIVLSALGSKVRDALASLPAMQGDAPDMAIVELGTNDCSGWPGATPTPAAEFEGEYRTLLSGLRTTRPGCTLILLGVWKQAGARATYDGILERLADEYSATYVSLEQLSDTATLCGPAGSPTYLGVSDVFHPNDAGHAAIAAAVENAVRWQCNITLDTGSGYTRARVVGVAISSRDRLGSIVGMRRRVDGGVWSAWRPFAASWPWHLTAADGHKRLAMQFCDGEGAVSLPLTADVTLDTQGPVTRALAPAVGARGQAVSLRYRVDDTLSPTASVVIVIRTWAGTPFRTIKLGPRSTGHNHAVSVVSPLRAGHYRYVVRATDLAGNSQKATASNSLVVK